MTIREQIETAKTVVECLDQAADISRSLTGTKHSKQDIVPEGVTDLRYRPGPIQLLGEALSKAFDETIGTKANETSLTEFIQRLRNDTWHPARPNLSLHKGLEWFQNTLFKDRSPQITNLLNLIS